MAKFKHLIDDDGWSEEGFEDVMYPLNDLVSLKYEIDNCVRTMDPEEMIDTLRERAQELLEAIESL